MDSVQTLATFFGWCAVVNVVILIIYFGFMVAAHDFAGKLFARMVGVSANEAKLTLFRVFQQYRVLVAVFNVAPYIALKIMS